MSRTTTKTQATPANVEQLKFALSFLEDEHETLLALSIALMNRLEPQDPDCPEDCADTTSWRIAQVLNERLSSTTFLKQMHQLVLAS